MAGARELSVLQTIHTMSVVHTASCSVSTGCCIPRCNVAGELSQLLALFFSIGIKNEGSHTSSTLYAFVACTGTTLPLLYLTNDISMILAECFRVIQLV